MSAAAKPVVWITRPQPGADRTAVRIEALGFEPLVMSLTEVKAVDPEIDTEDAVGAGFVAATSGNAIRLAPRPLLEALKAKTVYTVGDATKAEAETHGFTRVVSARGAVDDLAALIAEYETPGAQGLYLCGRRRTGDLEGKLAAKGICCRLAEVYAVYSVSRLTHNETTALTSRNPDAVLFHSALSAHAFGDAMSGANAQPFENASFFALSERIARALPDWARARTTVAAAPDEENLLAALRAAFAR